MRSRKTLVWIASLLVILLMLTACAGGVSQEEFDNVKAEQTALEEERTTLRAQQVALEGNKAALQADLTALEGDYSALIGTRDLDAGIRDLRDAIDIKFALASTAVQRLRQSDWSASLGPSLRETAERRLDEFIEDAQDFTTRTSTLSDQLPTESRLVYEKSTRLYEAKIKEALYLKELVDGISLHNATDSEILECRPSAIMGHI